MITKLVVTTQITDNNGPLESPYSGDGAFSKSFNEQLTDGTGTGKAQVVHCDQRTLGGSAVDSLDLAGGVTDQFGLTTTFTKIKSVMILPATANDEDLIIGGGSNPFIGWFDDVSDLENVRAGGISFHADVVAGWTVTATTGDILTITAGAGGAVYDIVIVGEGASA
jgi:hypothetical protein